jgi:hypothetical protein
MIDSDSVLSKGARTLTEIFINSPVSASSHSSNHFVHQIYDNLKKHACSQIMDRFHNQSLFPWAIFRYIKSGALDFVRFHLNPSRSARSGAAQRLLTADTYRLSRESVASDYLMDLAPYGQ